MATKRRTRQVRLTDGTVQRAQDISKRTGIAERAVLSLAVDAGLPAVEDATAKLGSPVAVAAQDGDPETSAL